MEETQKSNEFYEALEKATKMSVVDLENDIKSYYENNN